MIVMYTAMSKSRAIKALGLNLEKRLSEARAVLFLIRHFRKEEETGRLNFHKDFWDWS